MTKRLRRIKCYFLGHNRSKRVILEDKQLSQCQRCRKNKERTRSQEIQVTVGSVHFIEDPDLKRPNFGNPQF